MPTYEYRCHTCGINFEYLQSMSAAALAKCPSEVCPLEEERKGTGDVERRISAGTGLVFKGSGFYITDYKGSSSSPGHETGAATKEGGGTTTPGAASEQGRSGKSDKTDSTAKSDRPTPTEKPKSPPTKADDKK